MEYEYLPPFDETYPLQPSLFDQAIDEPDEYERLLLYWAGSLGISVEEARVLIVRDLPEFSDPA